MVTKHNVSGWIKQPIDPRDFNINHRKVSRFFANLPKASELPKSVDLRGVHMPPIVDQGDVGSCTANAAAAIIDYCEHVANGAFLTPSRAFQYWNTEVLDGSDPTQDNGGTIRSAVKAIATNGAVPDDWWPYDSAHIMHEPTKIEFDEGKKYLADAYVLVDQLGMQPFEVLTLIKQVVAGGFPLEFGSAVFNQIMKVGADGKIAMPEENEIPAGGHALVIVGYDDEFVNLGNSKGAFLIRNSWGTEWGITGYGWMPYGYLTGNISGGGISDVWVLTKEEWVTPEPCPNPIPPVPTPSNKSWLYVLAVAMAVLLVYLYLVKWI